MGSVTKRERAGRTAFLEARVTRRGHPTLSKSFRLNEKRKAVEWVQEQEARIRGGQKVSRLPEKTTVDEALADYLEAHLKRDKLGNAQTDEQGRKLSTLSPSKRYAVASVRYHLGKFFIASITSKRLQKFMEELLRTEVPEQKREKVHPLYDGDKRRTYSPSAARKLFYALKTGLEWHAREHEYKLDDGTFTGFELPSAWSEPRDRRLEEGEEQRLLAACDGMYKDPERWRRLIRLALETGMRAGELLGMQWDEVNMHRDMLFILVPKDREETRKGRQVPLSSRAQAILRELKKDRDPSDARVFHSLPKNSDVMGKGFKRITKRAGILGLRFHDLRHEAICRMYENTPLQTLEIALITGHTQVVTLARYADKLRPKIQAKKLDMRPRRAAGR